MVICKSTGLNWISNKHLENYICSLSDLFFLPIFVFVVLNWKSSKKIKLKNKSSKLCVVFEWMGVFYVLCFYNKRYQMGAFRWMLNFHLSPVILFCYRLCICWKMFNRTMNQCLLFSARSLSAAAFTLPLPLFETFSFCLHSAPVFISF